MADLQTTLTALGFKPATSQPYDITCYAQGKLNTSEVLIGFAAPRAFTIPAGATSSLAKAGVAATASTVLTLAKNGVAVGTLTFAASGTVGAWSVASQVNMAVGDILTLTAPATADATLADVAITIAGSRD